MTQPPTISSSMAIINTCIYSCNSTAISLVSGFVIKLGSSIGAGDNSMCCFVEIAYYDAIVAYLDS